MPKKDQAGKKAKAPPTHKWVRVKAVDRVTSTIEVGGVSGEEFIAAKDVAFELAIKAAAFATGLPAGPVLRYHTDKRHPGVYRCKVAVG